jgi:hypothetical protein
MWYGVVKENSANLFTDPLPAELTLDSVLDDGIMR